MTRRQALLLFAVARQASVLVLDVPSRRVLSASGASNVLGLPGSTLKPFVLGALLRNGRLTASESYRCPGRLRIGDRQLDCSHPRVESPMRVATALAYSCNCFVAQMAERFAPGELADQLRRYGFGVQGSLKHASQSLLALGEDGILTTLEELTLAYRLLAKSAARPVLAGLEEAVEYGTAQHARVDGVSVAGKTGSAFSAAGEPLAWFAGFMPSGKPEIVVAVMLQGRSGGADAAPIAGDIFRRYKAGRL